jgi:hypothetical protein
MILTFILGLGLSSIAKSQNSSSISGCIVDENRNALPYSSVCILNAKDSSMIKGTITDSIGKYSFSGVNTGSYLLSANYLGYDRFDKQISITSNKVLMDTIFLKNSTKVLKEVNVYAKRKIVEKTPEGFLFNVGNSVIASNGTALDALAKAPGVFINQQNGISLKGKSDIIVLIDGKPTNLSGEEEINYLKNLNADNIAKIKVITNPSSKYDAQGSGVIDIVTKKNKNYGLNGTIKYGFAEGLYSMNKPGFDLNYKNGKINIYGNYTYSNGRTAKDESENIFFSNNVNYDQQSDFLKKHLTNIYKAGADISLNENNIIGIIVNGYKYNNRIDHITKTSIDSIESRLTNINTNNKISDKTNDISYNLNYKWTIDTLGKELNIDLDYGKFNSPKTQNITNDFFDKNKKFLYSLTPSLQDALQDVDIKTAKLDFSCPINEIVKFEFGSKISSIGTDNNISFFNIVNGHSLIDSTVSNHFKYNENVQALYSTFSYTKEKYSLQLGLRYENSKIEGNSLTLNSNIKDNYYKFFPALSLEYIINDNNQLDFSYSSRIDRPSYWELNPFRVYVNPYCYVEGNPFLKAAYINSLELSYTFKQKYILSLNFEKISNPYNQIPQQDNVTKTVKILQMNLDKDLSYGVSLMAPFNPFTWWETSNTFDFSMQSVSSNLLSNNLDYQKPVFDFQTINTFTILKEKKLYAEISSFYVSPMIQGLYQVGHSFDLSIAIKKSMLRNKATISLVCSDILNTNSPTAKIRYFDQSSDYKFNLDTRIVRLNLS